MKQEDVPELAAGDHVRVVIEGEVGSVRPIDNSFWVFPPGQDPDDVGCNVYVTEGQTISIEKLEKPVRVGDVLRDTKDFSRAAGGTILRAVGVSGTPCYRVRGQNGWHGTSDGSAVTSSWLAGVGLGFEVVYIP